MALKRQKERKKESHVAAGSKGARPVGVSASPDLCVFYPLQDDDRVIVGMVDEQLLKVDRTRRQDHLVAANGRVVAREGHVAEGLDLKGERRGEGPFLSSKGLASRVSPAASCPGR